MKPLFASLVAGTIAVASGAAGAMALGMLPGDLGALCAGALICFLTFLLWPYSILPIGIVGGTVVAGYLAGGRVSVVIALHAGILAIGCLALLTRRVFVRAEDLQPQRTAADGAMLVTVLFLLVAAAYGLARGNAPHAVLVAAYEFAVIPAYFFLTTFTLPTPRDLAKAAAWYLAGAIGLTVVQLMEPDRHGGLLAALALPPLLVAASRVGGWKRGGLALLIAVTALDVVLASYRAIWLATGVALLVLALRGTARVRRTVMTAGAIGAVALPLVVVLSPALRTRALATAEALEESSGYRLPEASVGLGAFADQPLTGAGLGQSTPGVHLPDFGVTTVGPAYHVFYVMILANLGLTGLLLLRPLAIAVRTGLSAPDDKAVSFAALTCGFLVAAAFAGPTDGHWELGLLPAVTLLVGRAANSSVRPVPREVPCRI